MIELSKIEACQLLDLFEPVYQSISVYEEFSGGLGNVQIVLKELLDRKEGLLVEGLDRALLEYFLEEGLAEGSRQMIDQPCDAEIVVRNDDLIGIENFAYFKSDLGFLKGSGQISYPLNDSTDADIDSGIELSAESIGDRSCQLFEVLGLDACGNFLYEDDIALGDIEDKVLVLIGEEVLDNVESRNIVGGDDPDEQGYTGGIAAEMELSCLDMDISWEDVIEDNVFNEVVAVILLVVILLDARQSDSEDARIFRGDFVSPLNEHCIVRLHKSSEGLIGIAVAHKDIMRIAQIEGNELIGRPDLRQLRAGDDSSSLVNDAYRAVNGISHLVNYALK